MVSTYNWGKADMHIHTKSSPGCSSSLKDVLNKARDKDLKVIAITDKNTIEGALEAMEMSKSPGYDGPEILVGEEVETFVNVFEEENKSYQKAVHVLVYDINAEQHTQIKTLRKKGLNDLQAYLNSENIFCALAHPFWLVGAANEKPDRWNRSGIYKFVKDHFSFDRIKGLLDPIAGIKDGEIHEELLGRFDFIEFPSGGSPKEANKLAQFYVDIREKHVVSGSDAHVVDVIGSNYVMFDGKTKDTLMFCLTEGKRGEQYDVFSEDKALERNMDEELIVKWLKEKHPELPFRKAIAWFATGPYTNAYLPMLRKAEKKFKNSLVKHDF